MPGSYEDWLPEARAELERQCADLCDLLGETRARRGDPAGAAEAVRRRIRLRPLEEAGYRTLMQLQAALGDRAGAVSTYHHCASVLERELGIVPDTATRQVFQRLVAYADAAGAPAPAVEPAASRLGRPAAPFVGRAGELGTLRDAWRAALAGRPGLVLVRGGAGVGKTRLVAEVADAVRQQGGVVASSQCFGASGRLALAPVADWLRHPAAQSALVTLDEAVRVEVGRLVPSGHQAERPADSPPRAGSVTASSRAWSGPCSRWGARCCWPWTTCTGVIRRRWPS